MKVQCVTYSTNFYLPFPASTRPHQLLFLWKYNVLLLIKLAMTYSPNFYLPFPAKSKKFVKTRAVSNFFSWKYNMFCHKFGRVIFNNRPTGNGGLISQRVCFIKVDMNVSRKSFLSLRIGHFLEYLTFHEGHSMNHEQKYFIRTKNLLIYSKASRYTASRSADLGDTLFLPRKIYIYQLKS